MPPNRQTDSVFFIDLLQICVLYKYAATMIVFARMIHCTNILSRDLTNRKYAYSKLLLLRYCLDNKKYMSRRSTYVWYLLKYNYYNITEDILAWPNSLQRDLTAVILLASVPVSVLIQVLTLRFFPTYDSSCKYVMQISYRSRVKIQWKLVIMLEWENISIYPNDQYIHVYIIYILIENQWNVSISQI